MEMDDITRDKLAHSTPEEILQMAHEEGYELDDAQLEMIVGGSAWDDIEKMINGDGITEKLMRG